jgi:peptidylprolyl isomerase
MKKIFFAFSLIITMILCNNCQNGSKKTPIEETDTDTIIVDADQYIRFETSKGTFIVKLYKDTPLHRHNMVKQAKKGVYDGQLFFGVERKYKIQAGDPKSKGAAAGKALGIEEENDTIMGEIMPNKHYHKRGAIGQASMRQFNFSTSQQFYIITGKKCNISELTSQERKINKRYFKAVKDSLTQPYAKQILEYQKKKYNNKISVLNDNLNKETEKIMATRPEFVYSKEQIADYTTIGGAPGLDGLYTVFGEVIEGMEVIDAISSSHIDKNSRPVPDVKIIKATLIDNPSQNTSLPAQ